MRSSPLALLTLAALGAAAVGALSRAFGFPPRWTSFVARTAEKHKMSWAYWGFWRCGFEAFDEERESWTEPLLKSLAP